MSSLVQPVENKESSEHFVQINMLAIFQLLLRRWWILLICLVVGAGVLFAYAFLLLEPQYQSSISMYVTSSENQNQTVSNSDLSASRSLAETYIVILEDVAIRDTLSAYMLENYDNNLLSTVFTIETNDSGDLYISGSAIANHVSMTAVDDTEVVRISATTSNPEVSAILCDSYAAIAPAYLTRIVKAGSVEVIGDAKINRTATGPNVSRYTIVGAIVGLCAAAIVLIIIELCNNKIHTTEELEGRTGKAVLGEIARMTGEKQEGNVEHQARTLIDADVPFYVKEAYKALRSNFIFSMAVAKENVVAISSANIGEGKSTVSSNLALTLAQTGKKILLIDADMRKPVDHHTFHLNNKTGLSDVLAGIEKADEAIQQTQEENLYVMTSGPIPPNPSELLSSKRFGKIIEDLKEKYDYVIIDTPPVNVVTDAMTIRDYIAGIILVIRYDRTKNDEMEHAVKQLETADIPLLGFVLNDIAVQTSHHYYRSHYYKKYGYGYGYGYGYEYKSNDENSGGGNKKKTAV